MITITTPETHHQVLPQFVQRNFIAIPRTVRCLDTVVFMFRWSFPKVLVKFGLKLFFGFQP